MNILNISVLFSLLLVLGFPMHNGTQISKFSDLLVEANAKNIDIAIKRATKIIFALKSFSRFNNDGKMELASIKNGLETVLTLYHNKIKQGIDLIRNYENVGDIYCFEDELNQVWTNLIHNALQAMDYKGKLTIGLKEVDGYQVVSIKDTGCGITPEVKEKMFKPFFTTKKSGEGSGLGLDIVKKIVEKHKGKIEVDSEVGIGTEFRVYIPIKQENQNEGDSNGN